MLGPQRGVAIYRMWQCSGMGSPNLPDHFLSNLQLNNNFLIIYPSITIVSSVPNDRIVLDVNLMLLRHMALSETTT